MMAKRFSSSPVLKKRALQENISGTIWEPITPPGMRAGFVKTAYKSGVSDEEIMGFCQLSRQDFDWSS
jgi:hypothetical protein